MKEKLFLIGLLVAALSGSALLIGGGSTEWRIVLGIICWFGASVPFGLMMGCFLKIGMGPHGRG